MATKKKAKPLLEYDPLGWLKEDNGKKTPKSRKKPVSKKAAGKKSTRKKVAGKTSTAKKTTVVKKAKSVNEKSRKPVQVTEKKVSNQQTAGDQTSETTVASETAVENVNFGFFDDEPAVIAELNTDTQTSDDMISLGSELTIKNVAAIKQQIEAKLAGDHDINLDPGKLQKVDTAGLQMLYSLQKSLNKTSQQIHWQGRNAVLESAAELVGMDHLMDRAKGDSAEQNQGFGFF